MLPLNVTVMIWFVIVPLVIAFLALDLYLGVKLVRSLVRWLDRH